MVGSLVKFTQSLIYILIVSKHRTIDDTLARELVIAATNNASDAMEILEREVPAQYFSKCKE
jgi:hypothetical protein